MAYTVFINDKVIVDKKCRKCGKVPERGYFISRASRNDWLCPTCCNARVNENRRRKSIQYREGGGHD